MAKKLFDTELSDALRRRIEELSPAKRALLEQKLQESGSEIRPRNATDETAALSLAQERFWFLQHLEPDTPAYNRPFGLRLRGQLNVRALEEALSEILRRHQVLRSTIITKDGRPVQEITTAKRLTLPVVDLSRIEPSKRLGEASELGRQQGWQPFDLTRGPVWRATLYRLSSEEHILLWVTHHSVFDGWSARVFVKETAALYQARLKEEPSPLQEPRIQYADWAAWQLAQLDSPSWNKQLAYWKERLSGAQELLKLPTDRPRPSSQMHRGACQSRLLSAKLLNGLKDLGAEEGATLFMTLLAGFKALMLRYTDQEDILVGVPVAGRRQVECEELIGFFMNTLVLRTNLAGNPTFRELLLRVRETALNGYAHQDLPFERLLQELSPERNEGHTPLFQVMLNLENDLDVTRAGNLVIEEFHFDTGLSNFDLNLELTARADGLSCSLVYNSDLFEPDSVARMLRHYQTLLEGALADPGEGIRSLPLIEEDERRQIFGLGTGAQPVAIQQSLLHELFEGQVEREPDRVAVVWAESSSTYRELNRRATQLACYLEKLGVGPDVVVALCLERSVEMIVALLGILKAGGAYLPLDASYPTERLNFMLEDSQTSLLVTQESMLENSKIRIENSEVAVICLDRDWDEIAAEGSTPLCMRATGDNLAYVIYTSGSTGKPKGVMVTHRAVVNWASQAPAKFGICQDDRVLQFASISFDTAAEEIFSALGAGATLVLRPDGMLDSYVSFLNQCEEESITLLDLPTVYWHELVDDLRNEKRSWPASVKSVILGGELVQADKLAAWRECVGSDVQLSNSYGPTECAIVSTTCRLNGVGSNSGSDPSIGRPIGQAETFVVDRELRLTPIGVLGELQIGGSGLARGYLNRPDLTGERFVPNAFSEKPGLRLYKSGDLCRLRGDGNLEFWGRRDRQVKISGHRIELAEIESALRHNPYLSQAAVVATRTQSGSLKLIGYVVPSENRTPSIAEVRRFLLRKLPKYMVPHVIVFIKEGLPLSANGKVDLNALPAPDGEVRELDGLFVPPRTSVEATIAGIWAELLELSQIGVQDSFFELGGHSLLAIRVISRVRKIFGVEVPLRKLFEEPTVSALSQAVVARGGGKVEKVATAMEKISAMSPEEKMRLLERKRGERASGQGPQKAKA